jgi:transposase
MAKAYRPYVPEQDFLLPPSLREWLPEDHLAYFVSDLVDQLDLSAITTVYEEEDRGYPPYHPVMLTKVLVYAYCVGVFSSRKIQRRLIEDVPFRVLAAGNEPDFRTIADFRKRHLAALQGFFEQVLHLARELGTPRVGRVALAGSKVKANALKHKAMSYGRMREKPQLLAQAETANAAGRRGVRGGSARRRTAGGTATSRESVAADSRGETRPRAGHGRGRGRVAAV